jgi:hypothetical protein
VRVHFWKGGLRPLPARQHAILKGEKTYKGKPCPYGHNGTRYTQTAKCVECVSIYYYEYRRKSTIPIYALAIFLMALATTSVRAELNDFLVEDWCAQGGPGGCPSTLDTVITWEKRDLPGLRWGPGGQLASHSVYGPAPNYITQTWQFEPFTNGYVPSRGDGGQLLYIDPVRTSITMTRDGGKPYDQDFSPPNCGFTGWLLYESGWMPQGRWANALATLVGIPKDSNTCPTPGRVYTRWRIEVARMAFIWGTPFWRDIWVIIAEHFDNTTVETSQTMERGIFCQGLGWCAWEAWTRDLSAKQEFDLQACPGIYIKGGPYPLAEPSSGMLMTSCRRWTNIVWAGNGADTVRSRSWLP